MLKLVAACYRVADSSFRRKGQALRMRKERIETRNSQKLIIRCGVLCVEFIWSLRDGVIVVRINERIARLREAVARVEVRAGAFNRACIADLCVFESSTDTERKLGECSLLGRYSMLMARDCNYA